MSCKSSVVCEEPRLILNRGLLEFIRLNPSCMYTTGRGYHKFRWHGDHFSVSDKDLLRVLSRMFRQDRLLCKTKPDHIEECHFVADSGEVIEVFIHVACGHCSVCQKRKRDSFGYRCIAESSMYDYPPYFVTLTYDAEHLPADGSLDYSHVQKWLKRFRITLARKYGFKGRIRYACCGEYGKNTKRPHYHLLLWGIPYLGKEIDYKKLNDVLIAGTWNMGLTQLKRCFNSKAGQYIGKYMTKKDTAPAGCVSPFVHGSTRGGGIGAPWSRSVSEVFYKNPRVDTLHYRECSTNTVGNLPLVKYFVDKIVPTVSQLIPKKLRDAWLDLRICVRYMEKWKPADALLSSLRSLLAGVSMPRCLSSRCYAVPMVLSWSDMMDKLAECVPIVTRYSGRDYTAADAFRVMRSEFFDHVQQNAPDLSHYVFNKAVRAKRALAVEAARVDFL